MLKNRFSYEKITQINETTTPFTKRGSKTTPRKCGRGGVDIALEFLLNSPTFWTGIHESVNVIDV